MRQVGTIKLDRERDEWLVTLEPHAMIRLKGLFSNVSKQQFGSVRLKNRPEVCRDLEWFMQRYAISCPDWKQLEHAADKHRKDLEELEAIATPSHIPRLFDLARPLRGYQATAVEIYLKRRSLLVADELGLGKTIIAIGSFTEKATLPALVVCPVHIQRQWQVRLQEFLPTATSHIIKKGTPYDLPNCDVYISSYHKLAGWAEVLKKFIRSVVFDEAQELRHDGTQKYCAAAAIRDCCSYAMGLSATPIYNYGGEIFNLLDMLAPNEIGTRDEFLREWCSYIGNLKWSLTNPDGFGSYLKDQHIMIRRRRSEVGRELPAVQTIVETVEYDAKVLDDLDDTATALAKRILEKESSFIEKGEAAREFDTMLRQATGIAKAPFVAAFVRMLLEEGNQVVLTGWHRYVYDIWAEHLVDFKEKTVYYTGTESPAAKQKSVDAFVSKRAQLFVMSLRSGSGLDGLQEVCSTIVHGELDWSPAVHQQNTGRLHRDGQGNSVTEFFLVSDAGSDPLICEVLGLKKDQLRGLIDPGGDGFAALQSNDNARVKKMAEEYLKRRRKVSI